MNNEELELVGVTFSLVENTIIDLIPRGNEINVKKIH
jgi:hypothetical protein